MRTALGGSCFNPSARPYPGKNRRTHGIRNPVQAVATNGSYVITVFHRKMTSGKRPPWEFSKAPVVCRTSLIEDLAGSMCDCPIKPWMRSAETASQIGEVLKP